MPRYCFKCPHCSYAEEVQLPMGGAAGYRCSNCGKPATRDFKSEQQGTQAPRPIIGQMNLTRERTLQQRMRAGEFKLYDAARSSGMLS